MPERPSLQLFVMEISCQGIITVEMSELPLEWFRHNGVDRSIDRERWLYVYTIKIEVYLWRAENKAVSRIQRSTLLVSDLILTWTL